MRSDRSDEEEEEEEEGVSWVEGWKGVKEGGLR
jgi:hypothetical protein